MNLQWIVNRLEEKFHKAQERIAVTLLIWFEKEPAQDRVVTTPVSPEASSGPYLRYRPRARRCAADKEKVLRDRTGHAT